ncbi:MAG: folylpolyglutamate synthase/dihydrofolate synthase family protein [Desulfuromonadaceae bacterium]
MHSDAALDYLYSLGMFGIKLGLDNIRGLLERLGDPHTRYPIIHVAGTNGKGSVCAFLGQIYTRGGYRVGVYTSPHLEQFNERIRIGSELISTPEVADLTAEIRVAAQEIQPTFFEFTTAMALLYFARQKVDLVVLEVGMGGRLDATNVVEPALSIITPVAYDHTTYLGDSLCAIAAEKGGIVKPGVPLVLGVQTPEVDMCLHRIATREHAPCYRYDIDYRVEGMDGAAPGMLKFDITTPHRSWHGLVPGLRGRHQGENLGSALMALEILEKQGLKVEPAQVVAAVAQTYWPGRLEWIGTPAAYPGKVLLDGAHNHAGLIALQDYMLANALTSVHWVCGFKEDKDAHNLVPVLRDYVRSFYSVPVPVEAHWSPHDLVAIATSVGMEAQAYTGVESALTRALENCQPHEIVLVAGSLFLVAEVRRIMVAHT